MSSETLRGSCWIGWSIQPWKAWNRRSNFSPSHRRRLHPGGLFRGRGLGFPFPTYQWYLNDEPIDGATGRTDYQVALWADDEGVIKVVVSNELGEVESDEVDLTVLETLDEDLADAIDFEDGKVISKILMMRSSYGSVTRPSRQMARTRHGHIPPRGIGFLSRFLPCGLRAPVTLHIPVAAGNRSHAG